MTLPTKLLIMILIGAVILLFGLVVISSCKASEQESFTCIETYPSWTVTERRYSSDGSVKLYAYGCDGAKPFSYELEGKKEVLP